MDPRRTRVEAIFAEARHLATESELLAYLERACGGDATLVDEVQLLLQADKDAGDFLQTQEQAAESAPVLQPHEGAGTRIGRYKLLQLIGEGGFGTVFMAEQERPVRRKVALKIIKLGMDTRQVIARFEAERQALAMMDHPNIAKVLDAGATETGRPYFVMELVRGVPLTQYCDEGHLSTAERLDLFITVCKAVQHAHQKGIIHRDIKPSNILVTFHDDKPVPKVIDFGIAKATQARLTEKTLFTDFRQFIGTPQYMSPEQAQLSGLDVDTRSDVYSLGVVLYELLTGTTPLEAHELRSAAYDQMRQMIREVEAPRPSTRLSTMGKALSSVAARRKIEPGRLSALLRGELDWVVMKALEKDRTRRYDTANGLALDIQRYLNDEAVSAGPAGHWYVLSKIIRRHRAPVAALLLVAAALVIGVAGATYGMIRAVAAQHSEAAQKQVAIEQRGAADAARAQADKSRREAETALAAIYPNNGFRAWETGQDAVASLWFASAGRLAGFDTDDGRLNIRRASSWGIRAMAPVSALLLPGEWTRDVQVHRSGRYLLAAIVEDSDAAGEVRCTLWDLYHESQIAFPGELGKVTAVCWTPDGRRIAFGNEAGDVRILNFPEMEPGQMIKVPARVTALTFDASGRRLAIAAGDGASVWDCTAQSFCTPLLSHPAPVASVEFAPGAERLLTACWDQKARVFAVAPGKSEPLFAPIPHSLRRYNELYRPVLPVFFNEGKFVVTATAEAMECRSALDGTIVHKAAIEGGVQCMVAAADQLAISGRSQVRVFNTKGILQRTVEQAGVSGLALSPDERMVASVAGRSVNFNWDQPVQPKPHGLPDHSENVSCVGFSPDARFIVTVERGGLLRAWAQPTRPDIVSIPITGTLSGCCFSSDGKYLMASGSNFQNSEILSTRVYAVVGGEAAGPALEPGNQILSATFLPSAPQVAILAGRPDALASMQLQLWNWKNATRVAVSPLPGYPESLSTSPDGKSIVVVCGASEGLLLEAATGKVRFRWATVAVHLRGDLLDSASCFSPDSQTLITFDDTSLRVCRVADGALRYPVLTSNGKWTGVSFSHDGQRFATTTSDGQFTVRDAATGKSISPPIYSRLPLTAGVAFSNDDRRILSTNGAVQVWDCNSGELVFPAVPRVEQCAWGKNGSIIAQAPSGMQILDGRSGVPVSLVNDGAAIMFNIVSGGNPVVPVDYPAALHVVSIDEPPSDSSPLNACLRAELTASLRISASGALTPFTAREWMERWHQYRSASAGPSPLANLPAGAIAFHRQKASDARNGDLGCGFHLDQLLEAGAASPSERLLRAQICMRQGHWDHAADLIADVARVSPYDSDFVESYAHLLPAVASANRPLLALKPPSAGTRDGNKLVYGNWWLRGPLPLLESSPTTQPELEIRKPTNSVLADTDDSDWRMLTNNTAQVALGNAVNATFYAQRRIYAPVEQVALIKMKLDDGGRVWLNSEKIYEQAEGWKKSVSLLVRLKSGWNILVAQVNNQSGATSLEVIFDQDPAALAKYYLDNPTEGLAKGIEYADAAIAAQPDAAEPCFRRGEIYARLGKLKEAGRDYDRGSQLNQDKSWEFMQSALLDLANGDAEHFREKKLSFISRFRDSKDVFAVEHLGRVVAMDPDVDPIFDLDEIRSIEERVGIALQIAGDNESFLKLARGALQYRAGSYDEAIRSLQSSRAQMGLPAGQVQIELLMAMAHYRLGHEKQAQEALAEATDIFKTKMPRTGAADLTPYFHETLFAELLYPEAIAVVTGTKQPAPDYAARRKQRREWEIQQNTAWIAAAPTVAVNYAERARAYVRSGQFKLAAADFAKAIEFNPDEHVYWYENEVLLAYLNDKPAFEARRTEMLRRFADTRDHEIAERIAKAALMLPINSDELKIAISLSDLSLSDGAGEAREVWYPLAKGISEYRAADADPANFALAIKWLTAAKAKNTYPCFLASADFYLAMAYQRSHRDAEARTAFDAATACAQTLPKAGEQDLSMGGPFVNWLVCQCARREACAMFKSPADAAAPLAGPPTTNAAKSPETDKRE